MGEELWRPTPQPPSPSTPPWSGYSTHSGLPNNRNTQIFRHRKVGKRNLWSGLLWLLLSKNGSVRHQSSWILLSLMDFLFLKRTATWKQIARGGMQPISFCSLTLFPFSNVVSPSRSSDQACAFHGFGDFVEMTNRGKLKVFSYNP